MMGLGKLFEVLEGGDDSSEESGSGDEETPIKHGPLRFLPLIACVCGGGVGAGPGNTYLFPPPQSCCAPSSSFLVAAGTPSLSSGLLQAGAAFAFPAVQRVPDPNRFVVRPRHACGL